jgi:hypothetical protein
MNSKKKFKYQFGSDLWIYTGDKKPQSITDLTGIKYSRIREKGKPWFDYGQKKLIKEKICQENIWIISKELRTNKGNIGLDESLRLLLEVIESQRKKFMKIFLNKNYICLIHCYEYAYDYHIYFRIDSKIINQLKNFNLILDFDIYSFEDNAE